jgi:hypothetical protein
MTRRRIITPTDLDDELSPLEELAIIRAARTERLYETARRLLVAMIPTGGGKEAKVHAAVEYAVLLEDAIQAEADDDESLDAPIPGVCRVCGCTEVSACQGADGLPCHWTDAAETLCSACAETGGRRGRR